VGNTILFSTLGCSHVRNSGTGSAAAVIVTLALAIGANTAIFSIVDALMLTSLPYAQPDRLGTIFQAVQGPRPYEGPRAIDGDQWDLLRDNVPALQRRL
jgi:macrolide transport system ATP-binding/permease protein